jgi:hypothetical protein
MSSKLIRVITISNYGPKHHIYGEKTDWLMIPAYALALPPRIFAVATLSTG